MNEREDRMVMELIERFDIRESKARKMVKERDER